MEGPCLQRLLQIFAFICHLIFLGRSKRSPFLIHYISLLYKKSLQILGISNNVSFHNCCSCFFWKTNAIQAADKQMGIQLIWECFKMQIFPFLCWHRCSSYQNLTFPPPFFFFFFFTFLPASFKFICI